ncbi:hypothetical protein ASF59_09840 [Methylobacterium sp. Leaf121]|nr:hypothetical protein ASF59_09840 [Methylobacterium sp. Leaf121]
MREEVPLVVPVPELLGFVLDGLRGHAGGSRNRLVLGVRGPASRQRGRTRLRERFFFFLFFSIYQRAFNVRSIAALILLGFFGRISRG